MALGISCGVHGVDDVDVVDGVDDVDVVDDVDGV